MSTAVDQPLLLGIRHHGPGSARAVRRALAGFQPDIVLVEGPPEADKLLTLAGLEPPVALLAYSHADQGRSVFWPYAEFSPEWQAIRWAVDHGVPVRGCDLPAAHRLAMPIPEPAPDDPRLDPIAALAAAAGYDDPERWWEDMVEHRLQPAADDWSAPFAAIAEAMTEVRAAVPEPPEAERLHEQRREAHMRTVLRAARKQHKKVAVVCGAWHVPAMATLGPAAADAQLLRGLPKTKVDMTWVPWTHGRLAAATGYGAGVRSPGWYHHLFTTVDRPIARWLVQVAGVLRDEDLPVSSAHVIEAARLAESLAALRGRPLAGLAEVTEATLAVLCDGDELRLALVNRRLVVGERLGSVSPDVPAVPLVQDVTAAQRRLRLKPSPLAAGLDLDLRKPIDLDRSRLLHRLRLLSVPWGEPALPSRRGKGTFWESWQVCWRPEFAVDLVAASGYGTTLLAAATARAVELAAGAASLSELTELVEQCLLADLPDALPAGLAALSDRAALDSDLTHLMAALPALARSLRYGDVRGTDVSALGTIAAGMLVRICVGLPAAVTGLDDSAARALQEHVDAVHAVLTLLEDAQLRDRWLTTLARLVDRPGLPGLLGGRMTRLLHDAGRLADPEIARRMRLTLTVGTPPAQAAAWIEGFLAGSGLMLVHDDRLLSLVDGWIAAIPAEAFVAVLPLLRRSFGGFAAPERRAIGERVRSGARAAPPDAEVDPERARRVLPTIAVLLGREPEGALP